MVFRQHIEYYGFKDFPRHIMFVFIPIFGSHFSFGQYNDRYWLRRFWQLNSAEFMELVFSKSEWDDIKYQLYPQIMPKLIKDRKTLEIVILLLLVYVLLLKR